MTPMAIAGNAQIRRRLEAYVEYADLLAQQEEAAEAEDLQRFERISVRLDELEALLKGLPAAPPATPDEAPETAQLRDETAAALEQATRVQQRLAATLRARRDDTRNEIRSLDGRTGQVRSYLGRERSDGVRLNVRF